MSFKKMKRLMRAYDENTASLRTFVVTDRAQSIDGKRLDFLGYFLHDSDHVEVLCKRPYIRSLTQAEEFAFRSGYDHDTPGISPKALWQSGDFDARSSLASMVV